MAPPTTLLELATLEVTPATAVRDAAQDDLKAAQDGLAAAMASATDLGKQMVDLTGNERSTREALAASPTQADGIVLLKRLEELIIQRRALERRILEASEQIEIGRRAVSAMQAELMRATAELTTATADLAAEQKQADRDVAGSRAATLRDLARTPASSLQANATAALGGASFRDAKLRVETDIPGDLITRSRDRGDKQAGRDAAIRSATDDAKRALSAVLAATGGATGAVAQKQDAFDRADSAVRDYVQRGKERLDRAVGLLSGVTSAPPLSSDAVIAIGAAAAPASIALEQARDDAQADVDAKQAALDAARLAAVAVDPDAVERDAAVRTARNDLRVATSTLNTAERALTQADRDAVDAWEAAVPDSSWRLLADFETAKRILDDVAALDPTTLGSDLAAAEVDLAAARQAERKAERAVARLQATVRQRSDRAETAAQTQQAHLFSALRGDG
jgi:hypothetical protein